MSSYSPDLRRRIISSYQSGRTATYQDTASFFSVGYATVNRLLRRVRETGDVLEKPRGGNNPRRIDLAWLKQNVALHPDARAIDRVDAYKNDSGISTSKTAMYSALAAIGMTHKKRRPRRVSENGRTSSSVEPSSSSSKKNSIRRV